MIKESPLSVFNNFQSEITSNFEEILFADKMNISSLPKNNLIIFENNKLILMGYIKLIYHNNDVLLQITKPINANEFDLVMNIHKNWNFVCSNFLKYIQMYNLIANNFDDVPIKLIQLIQLDFENKLSKNKDKNTELDYFLIPFKTKIYNLFDKDKKYLDNIYNKFQYVLKIIIKNKTTFDYKIIRVLSSDYDENKNALNNIKYLEQDVIKKDTLKNNQFNNFIEKLFYYGEIINNNK